MGEWVSGRDGDKMGERCLNKKQDEGKFKVLRVVDSWVIHQRRLGRLFFGYLLGHWGTRAAHERHTRGRVACTVMLMYANNMQILIDNSGIVIDNCIIPLHDWLFFYLYNCTFDALQPYVCTEQHDAVEQRSHGTYKYIWCCPL